MIICADADKFPLFYSINFRFSLNYFSRNDQNQIFIHPLNHWLNRWRRNSHILKSAKGRIILVEAQKKENILITVTEITPKYEDSLLIGVLGRVERKIFMNWPEIIDHLMPRKPAIHILAQFFTLNFILFSIPP